MSTTKCGFDDTPTASGATLLVANGPSLAVYVGFDPTYDAKNPTRPPAPGVTGLWALVDTGATECCIDSQLAARLGSSYRGQTKGRWHWREVRCGRSLGASPCASARIHDVWPVLISSSCCRRSSSFGSYWANLPERLRNDLRRPNRNRRTNAPFDVPGRADFLD
jgi:hypothetical protein